MIFGHTIENYVLQNSNLAAHTEELDNEFKFYLNSPTVAFENDPFQYWFQHKTKSYLAEVELKYLFVPATSVLCERAFSQAGNILTLKKTRPPIAINVFAFFR